MRGTSWLKDHYFFNTTNFINLIGMRERRDQDKLLGILDFLFAKN